MNDNKITSLFEESIALKSKCIDKGFDFLSRLGWVISLLIQLSMEESSCFVVMVGPQRMHSTWLLS